MGVADRALADTSVFIAREVGRPLDEPRIPRRLSASMITVGELRLGLLKADAVDRPARLATLDAVLGRRPLPVNDRVAQAWSALAFAIDQAGRRMRVADSWIAATALAHRLAVVTQDADYDVAAEVAGLEVIRV